MLWPGSPTADMTATLDLEQHSNHPSIQTNVVLSRFRLLYGPEVGVKPARASLRLLLLIFIVLFALFVGDRTLNR